MISWSQPSCLRSAKTSALKVLKILQYFMYFVQESFF